jgi:phosphatidylcholine synthase
LSRPSAAAAAARTCYINAMADNLSTPSTTRARLLAWSVHLYTGLGLLLALLMAVWIVDGSPAACRWVFLCMLAATIIDATDGALARRARVKELLPGFDGRRLDDLIDFLTYAFLPLLFIWRVGLIPEPSLVWLVLPLLAAGYGFSQTQAKTEDGFFLGFPSYWNIIAFYLYLLPWPTWCVVGLLEGFALLTFIPLRYLYPSQGGTTSAGKLNLWTNWLGGIWAAGVLWLMWELPTERRPFELGWGEHPTLVWGWASLAFPIYYLVASWLVGRRAVSS